LTELFKKLKGDVCLGYIVYIKFYYAPAPLGKGEIIIIIIIIITDLYSAFRSEDTEALGAAQED